MAILVYTNCLAQADKKFFVADSLTLEPIEYACIVFADSIGGTYTNAKGFFSVPNNIKQIEISSIGYNAKVIILQKNNDTVFLSPKIYEISETRILPSKKKRKPVELGYAKENSIRSMRFWSGEEIAVYIPLIEDKNAYKLIKQVIFKERKSLIRNLNLDKIDYTSVFKINFYRTTENKEIGERINTEDIVFTSEVLKSRTKLDVSKYNIDMPENGIFVAIEWVGKINPETEEIITDIKYGILPSIRVSYKITNSIVYEKRKFINKNWQRVDENYEFVKQIKSKDKDLKEDDYYTPLISIVLE
jgi:hypothetical protein